MIGLDPAVVEMIENGPFVGIQSYELDLNNSITSGEALLPLGRYERKVSIKEMAKQTNIKAKAILRLMRDLKEVSKIRY